VGIPKGQYIVEASVDTGPLSGKVANTQDVTF
jgi:hypothetical protein